MSGSLQKLRFWHTLVAVLAVTAYFTDEVRPLHQWLGYAIAAMILLRLLMAMSGAGPLGLQRFYPHFHDLRLGTLATNPVISRTLLLGIAISLLGVTATGLLMDRGRALQSAPWTIAADRHEERQAETSPGRAHQDDDEDREGEQNRERHGSSEEEGSLSELHELFANLLLGLVALHVSYLILFKWPLARFMLFLKPKPR